MKSIKIKKPSQGKVALYNPYLDVLGGGEKHILSIIKVFDEENYQPYIFWDKDLGQPIEKNFSLQFINKLKFLPNIFKKKGLGLPLLKKLLTLKKFDYFFYVTDGSYFFSLAKKNYIFAMVPDKKLYPTSFIDKIKTKNYHFLANSLFTQKRLKTWGINADLIYPYVDQKLLDFKNNTLKEKIILSVGRFFGHLHSKRQDIIIKLFKKIKQENPMFKDFKLILAGGLKKEDNQYFLKLKKIAGNDQSIIFKPNISLDELYKLYGLATYFWHFAGYGVDELKNPDQVEHFGLSPLEAMAAGCLTFCYRAGGPKETIADGKTGFLFSDEKELLKKMVAINIQENQQKLIRKNAQKYIQDNFSYEVFKKRVKQLIIKNNHF
jgi:glycosyltransferase involved in cell wall biosynthesis